MSSVHSLLWVIAKLLLTQSLSKTTLHDILSKGIIGIPIKILLLPVLPLGDRNMLVR